MSSLLWIFTIDSLSYVCSRSFLYKNLYPLKNTVDMLTPYALLNHSPDYNETKLNLGRGGWWERGGRERERTRRHLRLKKRNKRVLVNGEEDEQFNSSPRVHCKVS